MLSISLFSSVCNIKILKKTMQQHSVASNLATFRLYRSKLYRNSFIVHSAAVVKNQDFLKMKYSYKLPLVYLAVACVTLIECLQTLHPNNGVDQGEWGPLEACQAGVFATGIEMRSDGHTTGNNDGLFEDHVGATAFRLYCGSEITGISSLECENNGNWLPVWHCPNQGFVIGLQQNVNPKMSDKLGVENIRVVCLDANAQTTYIDAFIGNLNGAQLIDNKRNNKHGPGRYGTKPMVDDANWSLLLLCSGDTSVCGLQTRISQNGLFSDNICLSDLILTCC